MLTVLQATRSFLRALDRRATPDQALEIARIREALDAIEQQQTMEVDHDETERRDTAAA